MDPRDTSILTRLGNLLVKENNQAAAVDVYQKVLDIDDTLHNVWFNKGNAQMHIGDLDGEWGIILHNCFEGPVIR